MKVWLVVAIPGLSAEKRVAILLVKIPSLVVAVAVEEPAPTVEEPPLLYLQKQSNYYLVGDFFRSLSRSKIKAAPSLTASLGASR